MAIESIKMPDIGEGIAEVELVAWHIKVGDVVAEDLILADVMTDKATVEIPSHVAGTVLSLDAAVGQVVAVGTPIIHINTAVALMEQSQAAIENIANSEDSAPAGETATALTSTALSPQPAAPSVAAGNAPNAVPTVATPTQTALAETASTASASHPTVSASASPGASAVLASSPAASTDSLRPIASPAVRRSAWELGVDLAQVTATGAAGRVTHADVQAYVASHSAIDSTSRSNDERYVPLLAQTSSPVIGLRRKIAQKMQEAKRRIPHFTYVEEIDVTELEDLRTRLNTQYGASRGRLTLLPFLIRAMVLAVRDHPEVNARYDDDAGVVTRFAALHLGLATQTDGGLMVPVIRHAETLDLWACAAAVTRTSEAARNGKASREDLSGSTLTLTSLGALGGIVSTPVINHPEVAIVGTNRIVERPMIKSGLVVARKMMNLSSSFDHRVVDGMNAAQFIQQIRGYLECPGTLLVT